MTILLTLILYFLLLLLVSTIARQKGGNDSFFRGRRQSPWYLVAFGMVGASISGISLLSVPGMALTSQMSYLQMCLGFIPGYLVVAFVLLPLYYKLNLTSIYGYLEMRFGHQSHRSASLVFLICKMTGAAVKFYAVCYLLHQYVMAGFGLPFWATALMVLTMIWLYTRKGGVGTLVYTDTLQTICLTLCITLLLGGILSRMDLSLTGALERISTSGMDKVFFLDDLTSPRHFLKQFLSGLFVVVVMTGLDQDMMQKNLTCKTLRDAQKDMCSYSLLFVPINFLLLVIGILLALHCKDLGMALPEKGDDLMSGFVASGDMGQWMLIFLMLGVSAASFSSADSSLTAITTVMCVDILKKPGSERTRRITHLLVCLMFLLVVLLCHALTSGSLLDTVYTLCGYTYGPLLGLFTFGLMTRRKALDKAVPYIVVLSPLISYLISWMLKSLYGYTTGYELLLLNGTLTFLLLFLTSRREEITNS